MSTVSPAAVIDRYPGPAEQADGPLSPGHLRELTEANQRARKLRTAARLAAFNGWMAAVFAVLSLPFALFSMIALVVGTGLAVVAWNEFRGRNLIRRFDPRGPRVLGWNQIGFMGLLIGYSLWCIYGALTGPNPYDDYLKTSPELKSMLGPIANLYTIVNLAVYGSLIILSCFFQGINAVYYFSRAKHLQAYRNQTAAWIIDLQRRMAGI